MTADAVHTLLVLSDGRPSVAQCTESCPFFLRLPRLHVATLTVERCPFLFIYLFISLC